MAIEEKKQGVSRPHNVILEGRSRLSVSGVEEVASFDEERIVMYTTKGTLIVTGTDLNVGKLSLENGELSVDGLVSEMSYEEIKESGSLWSRLFK